MDKPGGDLSSRLRGLGIKQTDGEAVSIKVRTAGTVPSSSTTEAPATPVRPQLSTAAPAAMHRKITVAQAQDSESATSYDPLVDEVPTATQNNTRTSLDDALADIRSNNENDISDGDIKRAYVGQLPTWRTKIRDLLYAWWHNKKARYATLGLLIAVMLLVMVLPTTRYATLGAVGVKGTARLTVIDSGTDQPLKNVMVTAGTSTAKTDSQGVALLKARVGSQSIAITKRGFATVKQTVTIKTGTTVIPELSLKAVGAQFTFTVVDFVSGKPIANAEAVSGEANANADNGGKMVLTTPGGDIEKLTVQLSAKGYRDERITLDSTTKASNTIKMVSAVKTVYVSNREGKFNLYSSYIDGKDRKVLLEGTGRETRNSLQLAINPKHDYAAFVSTRDDQRNKDGFLLSAVTLINLEDGSVSTVEHAENVKLIGWSKDTIVYEKTAAGTSAGNVKRSRIIAYDYQASKRNELAATNYFIGAKVYKDTLYYANSSTDPANPSAYFKVGMTGSGRQKITDKTIWAVQRVAYDKVTLQTPNAWLNYTFGGSVSDASQPSSPIDRVYSDNTDATKTAWVDQRDGKGVLIVRDIKTGKEQIIKSDAGIEQVRWLGQNTLIYHIVSPSDSGQYAIAASGGSSKKISDITTTN